MRPPAGGLVCMLSVGPSMGERGRSELFGMRPAGGGASMLKLLSEKLWGRGGLFGMRPAGRGASMLKLLSEKLWGRGGLFGMRLPVGVLLAG